MTICEAFTEKGERCCNDAIYRIKNYKLCGVHSRNNKDEREDSRENDKIEHGRKLCIEKMEKMKKIKYLQGFEYIYIEKNNRKKGRCMSKLSFSSIKDVTVDDIKFKTLESLYFSSLKFKEETMEKFKVKQELLIKNGGKLNDRLDAEKYFIGDNEYTPLQFRKKIFSIYKQSLTKNPDFKTLVKLRKEGINIIITGLNVYTTDVEDISQPFMEEAMLYNILLDI